MPYDFSTWDRNCELDQPDPITGSLSGSFPGWLRGSFLINGPGKMKFGDQEYKHVFDGAAIIQKIQFGETEPVYSSKFLKTNAFQLNSQSQQIVVSEFGTKGTGDSKGGLSKLGNKLSLDKMFSDNAPLNIVNYGGLVYANTEAPFLHHIDIQTLDTMEKVDLNKEMGANSQCPHPITLKDGSTLAVMNSAGATGPHYDIYNFPSAVPAGKASVFTKPKKLASVDARWKLNPCHIHSFGVSDNYVVIPEQPLTIDVKALIANTFSNKPFIDGMEWMKDKLVKLRVISRSTGKEVKIKFKSDPFFYLHLVNTFEQDGYLVFDICTFKEPHLLYSLYLKKLREEGGNFWKTMESGKVIRIVLPLNIAEKTTPEENLVKLAGSKAGAYRQKDGMIHIHPESIADVCYENPTLNPKFVTQKYKFFYGASGDLSDFSGKVGKVDVSTREVKLWSRSDLYACVLSFVAKPGATDEDDGIILVWCIGGGADKSKTYVVGLDATSMQEIASVSFSTPSEAPRGLHGLFIAA